MTANRSTAVMQRRKVAPDSLDYFPTPPFATRALCEFIAGELGDLSAMTAWEPACGEGHMAKPLLESCGAVRLSDVHRYDLPEGLGGHELIDFAFFGDDEPSADLIITNPPFPLAQAFIEIGLRVARLAVCMLVRSAFLEGQDRHANLWTRRPPTYVLQFSERVVLLEGRLVRRGSVDPFHAKPGGKATSATAYVWLVWIVGSPLETRLKWISPSIDRLERPGDYPDYTPEILGHNADGLFGHEEAA